MRTSRIFTLAIGALAVSATIGTPKIHAATMDFAARANHGTAPSSMATPASTPTASTVHVQNDGAPAAWSAADDQSQFNVATSHGMMPGGLPVEFTADGLMARRADMSADQRLSAMYEWRNGVVDQMNRLGLVSQRDRFLAKFNEMVS